MPVMVTKFASFGRLTFYDRKAGLAAAFTTWALRRSMFFRQGRAVAAGAAAGGATLVGALMAGGCSLIGCCGSPMLAAYLSLFGAKALGLAEPLMALVTLVSVSCGYWCLSRRFARGEALAPKPRRPHRENDLTQGCRRHAMQGRHSPQFFLVIISQTALCRIVR